MATDSNRRRHQAESTIASLARQIHEDVLKNELGFGNHPAEKIGSFGQVDWPTTRK
jgi:hypothetical protein